MGTNYHWITDVCEHCKRGSEPLHIGKSSAGWAFSLRVYPDRSLVSLNDWIILWLSQKGEIRSDYGKIISLGEMLVLIMCRSHPRGLSHATADNYRRVQRGEGTWDYCDYEFS